MLLHPNKYIDKEWKQILSLLIDFANKKAEYEETHYDLAEALKKSKLGL